MRVREQIINMKKINGLPMHLPASIRVIYHGHVVATHGKRQLFFPC